MAHAVRRWRLHDGGNNVKLELAGPASMQLLPLSGRNVSLAPDRATRLTNFPPRIL
jgi:hypothetical protein